MRIEFDTGNAAELIAVGALIASLRGSTGEIPALDLGGDHAALGEGRTLSEHAADAAANGYCATETTTAVSAPLPPVTATAPPVPALPVTPPPPPGGITAPVAQSPGGVELDADGLPYDQRIHSSPASKKKDGKWRGKRNLDDATREAVTAELRAALAAPGMGSDPLPVSAPPVDAATAFAAPVAAPVIEAAAPPPPPPPPPPVAEPVVVHGVVVPPPPAAEPVVSATALTFADLMRKITSLQSAGALDVTGTQQIATSLGLNGVRDLMVRPDLIPAFEQLLPVAG